jgi:hypothetical protein
MCFQKCFNTTSTSVTCPMPRVPLPTDFEDYLKITSGQVRKRRSPIVTSGNGTLFIQGPNGRDKATVYIGAIFDGDRTYENFTSSLPSVHVTFYPKPVINSSNDVIEFNPSVTPFIDIRVSSSSTVSILHLNSYHQNCIQLAHIINIENVVL